MAEQEEQLLVPAGWIEPSELPKEQTDSSRSTSAALHWGQRTSASRRISSFSNFLSQDLQRYSKMGMMCFPCYAALRSLSKDNIISESMAPGKLDALPSSSVPVPPPAQGAGNEKPS